MNPSSTPAPAIWVDVTTLMRWQRPAVGIVRVELQFCLWLLQTDVEVQFCCYDKHRQALHPVPRHEIQAHIVRIQATATATAVPAPARAGIAHWAKRLLNRLPAPMAAALHPRLSAWWAQLQPLRHRLRSIRPRLRAYAPRPRWIAGPTPPTAVPAPGSVYVSMGLDWDDKDMAHLYRLKQTHGLRCLLFCYDIIPVKFPHLCVADVSRQFAHYFADLAWTADRILCISDATRHDLLHLLQRLAVPAPPVMRIQLGADLPPVHDAVPPSPEVAQLLRRPFLLYVSTIERRKNHEILYRAYARLAEEGVSLPQLVFVGMPGWGVQELLSDIRLDPRVRGLIVILHHVRDAELAALYRHALFTVYPSLYEGWGLPVAESLAFGKYCLCANTSSLPEVGQGLVDHLDPWDLPAWVEKLRFLITHPDWVAQRNADIAQHYAPHAWRDTAAHIYQNACQLLGSARPVHPHD